jgi:hypothetical protein
MQHIDLAKLKPLAPHGLGVIAFETGTFLGKGSRFLAENFPRVVTIELSEELHREAKASLAGQPHIECLQGNSAEVLARILPSYGKEQTAFFFLDAHWSGDQTVDWKNSRWKGFRRDTAHLGSGSKPSGPEQCPLLAELAAIAEYWQGSAHILIDDTRNIPAEGPGKKDFAFLGEDWSHLSRETVLNTLGARLAGFHLLKNPEQYFLKLSQKPA